MPSSSEQSSYSTRVTLVTVIARKALGSAATRESLDARDPQNLVRWRASEHRQGRSWRKRRAGLALLVDAALAEPLPQPVEGVRPRLWVGGALAQEQLQQRAASFAHECSTLETLPASPLKFVAICSKYIPTSILFP